ncbi:hypothetical protein PAMA_004531 [Pampus argenteus]
MKCDSDSAQYQDTQFYTEKSAARQQDLIMLHRPLRSSCSSLRRSHPPLVAAQASEMLLQQSEEEPSTPAAAQASEILLQQSEEEPSTPGSCTGL